MDIFKAKQGRQYLNAYYVKTADYYTKYSTPVARLEKQKAYDILTAELKGLGYSDYDAFDVDNTKLDQVVSDTGLCDVKFPGVIEFVDVSAMSFVESVEFYRTTKIKRQKDEIPDTAYFWSAYNWKQAEVWANYLEEGDGIAARANKLGLKVHRCVSPAGGYLFQNDYRVWVFTKNRLMTEESAYEATFAMAYQVCHALGIPALSVPLNPMSKVYAGTSRLLNNLLANEKKIAGGCPRKYQDTRCCSVSFNLDCDKEMIKYIFDDSPTHRELTSFREILKRDVPPAEMKNIVATVVNNIFSDDGAINDSI